MLACALYIAQNYECKTLITHTYHEESNLESSFFGQRNFEDSGINSINRLVKSGELSSIDFETYTNNIIPNRLDMLIGSNMANKEIFIKNIGKNITTILNSADDYYDLTFIDLSSTIKDELSKKILKISDVIVVNLSQEEKLLVNFFKNDMKIIRSYNKPIIFVIGKYDFESKCSKKYIQTNFKIKEPVYYIPYHTDFLDSMNNHKVYKFFLQGSEEKSINTLRFFECLEILGQAILDNHEEEFKEALIEKNDITNRIKKIFKIG